ncbi:hypothetical protein AJ79_01323 [Helicocarpus griseus UAMH5409]|uniref:Uncharacterized protein n=1 Tax=Helicocarpus griseus UAMH5409 TaxID=1447875 RepID=A0A2B7Y7H3_9EURO|nr:hypothetical protein AJ79_01323 [Helicocarpus griseus UAMH5409]
MTLDASTAAKLISCVRVNPHHVVGPDSGPEEREVITTISRQPSHALFTSKQIRVLGPLLVGEGGIPLHEYLVGVADRQVSSPKRFENLPNPASTTYYAHYSGDNLTAEQFEVMWQFDNFAKMGKVDGFNDRLTERVLTLRGTVVAPHSTFDVIRRDYVYEGWTKLHFLEFFDLYCIVKAGAEARLKPFDVTNFRWVDVKPPRFLNEDEVESYFDNIQQGLSDSPNRLSKLGSTLDNLASSREDPDRGRKLTNPPVKRPDNVPGRRHSNRHRNGQRRRTWHNEPLSNRVEWPSSSSLSQRARGAVEKRSSSGSRPRNHPRYSNRNQGPGSERTSPGYRFRNHTRNSNINRSPPLDRQYIANASCN